MAIMDVNVKELNCNLIYIYIVVDASSSMCANVIDLDLDESILFLHMTEDEDTGILINKNDVCEIMTEKSFLEDRFQSIELFDISLSVLEMTICNFIKYRVYFYGNASKLLPVGSIKERSKKLNTSRLRISIGILLLKKFFIVKLLNTDSITYQENNYNFLVGEIWGILGNEYLLKDNQYHFIKALSRKININIRKEILILNNCYMRILFPIWLSNVRRGSV